MTLLLGLLAATAMACSSTPGDEEYPPAPDAGGASASIVRQVLAYEESQTGLQLAFGTNPDFPAGDDGVVSEGLLRNTPICVIFGGGQVSGLEEMAGGQSTYRTGAAIVTCNGVDVPVDPSLSLYDPFGSQSPTYIEANPCLLGPAAFLWIPDLPGGSTCTLAFDDGVVGQSGERPCAPPGGDPAESCTPADLSRISFSTTALRVVGLDPRDTATNVSVSAQISVQLNARIDNTTVSAITLMGPNGPVAMTAMVPGQGVVAQLTPTAPLQSATTYAIHVAPGANGLKDVLGGQLETGLDSTFTTQ